MEAVQNIMKWVAILGIGVASLLALSGWWMTENADVVAVAAIEASGIKEQRARLDEIQCAEVTRAFHDSWDKAVDSGTLGQRQEMLDRLEARMDDVCAEY
jgi:hypothetical protein